MSGTNLNVVAITGNLTRDPELRQTHGGTAVCAMRIAVNTRIKRDGSWTDKPNYFDVTVWGGQGENCAQYLSKGRACAIQGRLDWREWEDKEGNKRQAVQIVAETVQFLSDGKGGGGGSGSSGQASASSSDQSGEGSFGVPAGTSDDDIPF